MRPFYAHCELQDSLWEHHVILHLEAPVALEVRPVADLRQQRTDLN